MERREAWTFWKLGRNMVGVLDNGFVPRQRKGEGKKGLTDWEGRENNPYDNEIEKSGFHGLHILINGGMQGQPVLEGPEMI